MIWTKQLVERADLVVPENSMKWLVGAITVGIMVYGVWFVYEQSRNEEQQQGTQEVVTQTPESNTEQPVEQIDGEEETSNDSQFTSQKFKTISDTVKYDHVDTATTAPYIVNDAAVDAYLQKKAVARGYQLRHQADESHLVAYASQRLQPEVVESLKTMQAAAKKEGMNITFVSGYRSIADQRRIVLNKLGTYTKEDVLAGKLDATIESILVVSSLPGYSKHHTGYTIDIACGNYDLSNAFMKTKCYEWLSKDNFKNARAHNFIPSYPVGIENQGPNPESWEFVWVPSNYLE